MCGYLNSKHNARGLSLVEILVTVAILSISLVMIVRSFMTSLRALEISKGFVVARLLLEEKMWQIKQQGAVTSDRDEREQFADPHGAFEYTLRTRAVEGGLAPQDLHEVSLTVAWREGRRTNEIAVVTYMAGKSEQ